MPCTQWMYYFGIRETLVDANFGDPFFVSVIGRDRHHDVPGPGLGAHQGAAPWLSWGSPESKRLDEAIYTADRKLTYELPATLPVLHPNSTVEFALDGGQMYAVASRETGIWVIRCVYAVLFL